MSHFYSDIHRARVNALFQRLKHTVLEDPVPLSVTVGVSPEPVPFTARGELEARPIREGEHWGDAWDCGWFHVQGRVPADWRGKVALNLNFGGEACVFDSEGCPVYGLTNGSVFDHAFNKDIFPFLEEAKGGERIDLWIEAGANDLFGVKRCVDPAWVEDASKLHGAYDGTLCKARVCRFNADAWHLWLDLGIALDLIQSLPEGSARRMGVLRIASRAAGRYAAEGAKAARAEMARMYALDPDPAAPDVYGIGHAHIDVGWLWPLRETVRKCGRTFASQIALLARYPEYRFGASQAQLYAFTQTAYPALYEKIKRAVAEGRWEVQGGMWVEADCNLPDGESLVRQCLVGKNFFRDEFGVEVKNLWLPDVFGYSGNLPQILRRAGMDYFLTQKLSWNRYNKFPHNTFWWRGIDGSRVLAHFPPEDAYDSELKPSLLKRHETNNAEAGLVQEGLCLYGIGDGGGGPSEPYVERGLRCRHLNGCPTFHFGFAQPVLEKLAGYGDELDTWDGELYFEMHRGTLTSQAQMKRVNRRGEETFRATEMLLAAAGIDRYPAETMLELWKRFLTNQFHDIIPGSCIHRVYAEQIPEDEAVIARLKGLQIEAAQALFTTDESALTFFNPSSTPFAGRVRLPAGWEGAADGTGAPLPAQRDGETVDVGIEVPSQGTLTVWRRDVPAEEESIPIGLDESCVLENGRVRYVLDPEGLCVRSCFDKELGREMIPEGEPGNQLALYPDLPPRWDAWDIEEYALERAVAFPAVTSARRIGGAVWQGIEAAFTIGESQGRQTIRLEAGSKRLDVETEIDWQENHRLLRVAFPVTVEAQEARYEIQYGHVARPTHDNTKWQHAQFECVGHRFADLSEPGFGAALLNDSKYGYRVKGHELSLSLLRAPTEPDPVADRGVHRFTYAFLPHWGDLFHSDVWEHAAVLNQGVVPLEGFVAGANPLLPIRVEGVELAVAKRAEKERCLVVRLVERRGVRCAARITLGPGAARLVECDLMEWKELGEIDCSRPLDFEPFAIRTFKVMGG
ncbi:MAG: alpha-mannosidase [Kiritimatiellae bacterium]|nr:alpha-mannosidase [Kiritimatiellia bacterium]